MNSHTKGSKHCGRRGGWPSTDGVELSSGNRALALLQVSSVTGMAVLLQERFGESIGSQSCGTSHGCGCPQNTDRCAKRSSVPPAAERLVQALSVGSLSYSKTTSAGIPKLSVEEGAVSLYPLLTASEMGRALVPGSAGVAPEVVSGWCEESPATRLCSHRQVGSCSLPQFPWASSSARGCLILAEQT